MRAPRPTRAAARAAAVAAAVLLVAPAFAGGVAPAAAPAAPRPRVSAAQHARIRAVLHLETAWLRATSAKEVAPILAADFVHPVAAGVFLDRAQHLAWVARHPPDPKLHRRFSALKIRLLGDDVAVVNGRVDARDARGRLVRRTVFTDVFQYLHGAWKAVSAQETPVRLPARPATKPAAPRAAP